MQKTRETFGFTQTLSESEQRRLEPFNEAKRQEECLPLSYGQKALWFINQLEPKNIAHNIVHAVQLRLDADIGSVQWAFQKIVDRHPVLRTTFGERHGEPVQRVHKYAEICFKVENASDYSKARMEERLAEEVFRPFDLKQGPLFRVTVLLRAPRNHIIVVAMHHIVTDLWSIAIMISEWTKLYHEHNDGIPASLKPIPFQYSDHVRKQAEMIAGPEGERLWNYWREKLPADLPPLDLPTDRPRPPLQTGHGAARNILLDARLTRQLHTLAKDSKTPLSTLVLAAFQILLHRYTSQDDICVGSPRAGRSHRMARAMGYFINPVVIKANFKEDKSFSEFVEDINHTVEGAFKHGAFPFPLLVERLAPKRELNQSPLIQVVFAWQKTTSVVNKNQMASMAVAEEKYCTELGDSLLGPVFLKHRAVPFDLGLWVAEAMVDGEERLTCTLEYKTDLFDETSIHRMLDNFQILIAGIVENPDQRISELPLLKENERRQLLVEWNNKTPADFPDSSVTQLFEAQVNRTPDAIAVTTTETSWTYAELNKRANQLAHYLQKIGVRPESLVGVCVDRSMEAIVALMAVLKCGGVYLPIDPASPADRMEYMLKDANVKVLLTQEKFRIPHFAFQIPNTLFLDTDWNAISKGNDENLDNRVAPENAAYVIYTSGSTGLPKAVVVSHGTNANHCFEIQSHYQLTGSDRVLQFAALNFDASLEQIIPTLISGGQLVLMDQGVWSPTDFQSNVVKFGITVSNLPPAYFHQVIEELGASAKRDPVSHLRLIVVGGDVALPGTIRLWSQSQMKNACLLNAYGPTETTITATTFEIPSNQDEAMRLSRIPIGRPLPTRKAYIFDKYGNPAPFGVAGELHMGGSGLARGYLNQSEKTAVSFVPDPYSDDAGSRLYRTGDLARYQPNGDIEFLGRVDHQVKIRGFRIELEEIEVILNRHPKMREAVVLAREDTPGEKHLVAYLVADRDFKPSADELRSFLKKSLPDYMIPSAFVTLDALPLNSSGKVDRRALLSIDAGRLEPEEVYVAPRTFVEKELAGMWAEVLGFDRVGINDNFFELGGHSLMATQLISRIRSAYHMELPLRLFFDTPTVAGLTKLIEERLIAQEEVEEIEHLLTELEKITDDDARRGVGTELGQK